MPVKIRLQRHGKKAHAFFHIVIADGRAPRDGKFIEKIGTYNPTTNPATIDLNFDKAVDWLQKGAQLTDTSRAILSYKGVMYKYHLLKGVAKKAMTVEQAEAKFSKWLAEKEGKISAKKSKVTSSKEDIAKKRFAADALAKEARAAKQAAKAAPPAAEVPVSATENTEAPVTPAAEVPAAENTGDTPPAAPAAEA